MVNKSDLDTLKYVNQRNKVQ